MNIGEAQAVMRILDFLAGDIDHDDEATRASLARDCLWIQTRARGPLAAGRYDSEETWNDHLAHVTLEAR